MLRFDVFGVLVDDLSQDELFARFLTVKGLVITPNPEILLAARASSAYRACLQESVLSLPDGIATRFAIAALYGHLGLRRHTGIDTIPTILSVAEQQKETLVILGGYRADHEVIRASLQQSRPGLSVVCIDPGNVPDHTTDIYENIAGQIRALGPCIVLVALGQGRGSHQGKQEFIAQSLLKKAPNVHFAIGIGGSIDVLAGRTHRGPAILRRFGFEWMWRWYRNPWRTQRMIRALIFFPILVAWDTLFMKRFFRACLDVGKDLSIHFTKNTL